MTQSAPEIISILKPYQERVEARLKESIPTLGEKNRLRDACEYALLNGGKRFRPILVYMVAEALANKIDVTSAALAVEFFHTASLIADDLPCMDNDDLRRNKPTLHKIYGEGVTLLSTYALIAAGYERLAKNADELRGVFGSKADTICRLALENTTYNTGLHGATGGQFLDVFPPDLTAKTLREIIHKKTVSLFEISFVLGWLYGGGETSLLDKVKQAAAHFGMAFQIADDLEDMDQDAKNQRQINMANVLGIDETVKVMKEEIEGFTRILKVLKLENSPLQIMVKALIK